MTVGSCLGVLLILAWSRVSNLAELYLVWAGIGLTMAAVLYEPAFATVTAWFERRRPRALTVVTLFAGFASTIFLPLTSWLVGVQGWRSALVTLALVLAAATILPHALVLRRRPEDLGLGIDGDAQGSSTGGAPKPLRQSGLSVHEVMGTQSFRWLVVAFSLSVGVATALRVQLVPYLVQRGLGIGTAAAFTGTIGAMQVFGRVVVGGLSERITGRAAAVIALGMQPVALFILILARERLGLTAFVVLFGASYGAMTLVRPALLAERYGRRQYASIAGVLAFVLTLSQSALPLAAGKASDLLGSYDPIIWAFVLLSSLAALALLAVG
jgi:MFS family permease